MNKQEFLAQLRKGLSGLPKEDIEERLTFYSEMIDDRIEDGVPEETAVLGIGSIDGIVSQIIAEIPIGKLVKEKITPRKKMKAWEIVLIVLGSPIWLAFLIAAFAVGFTLYIVLWAVIVVLWSVFVTFVGCAIGCIVAGTGFAMVYSRFTGIVTIGTGFACAGLAILMLFGCKAATKGILSGTRKLAIKIKKKSIEKKEN